MEVVVESLERLDAKLQGQPRAVRFLWDKQRDGSFMPVDENVMSDFIRDHLETDIAKSGIVLNREVQLRPSVAPETGERTDIHVDALSFDPIRRNQDRLTVVVENKGAWNGELRSAMKTQLHGKYLAGTGVRRGVYVVGWFRSALWTRTDRRKRKVPANADLVVAQLREQAEGLSTDGIRIQVVGIDATLPGELKNAKKPKAMTSDRKNDLRGRSRRARSAATGRAKAASAPKTNKAKGLGAAKAAKKVGAVARRTRK